MIKLSRYAKETFRPMLEAIPGAILAGGAVRDSILGNRIKDVDVFVRYDARVEQVLRDLGFHRISAQQFSAPSVPAAPPANSFGLFNPLTSQSHHTAPKQQGSSSGGEYASGLDTGVVCVFNRGRTIHSALGIDVIMVKGDPIEHVVNNFDLAICKAWYDGSRISATAEFNQDVANKKITICTRPGLENKPKLIDGIMAHAERIRSKYDTFTIVNPYSNV